MNEIIKCFVYFVPDCVFIRASVEIVDYCVLVFDAPSNVGTKFYLPWALCVVAHGGPFLELESKMVETSGFDIPIL